MRPEELSQSKIPMTGMRIEPANFRLIAYALRPRASRQWSRSNVAGIVTTLRAGGSRFRVPLGARTLSLLRNVQAVCGAHPAPFSLGTVVLSRG